MPSPFAARALPALTALALTACVAVGPDYTPVQGVEAAGWQRLDPADGLFSTAPSGDLSQWWRQFDDPLLTTLVDEALAAGPDLRSAVARLREARARRTTALAGFFPEVTGTASGRSSKSSSATGGGDTRELYSAGFDAGWELDLFGGVRRGVEAADADLAAAAATLEETRVSLAAEVAANYVEVRSLQLRLAIARDNLASQSETLQLTEWREQAGLANRQEVDQARSNREQTRAQIPALQTALAEAEHRLDLLLGRPPGTLHPRLAAAGDLPPVPEQIAVGIPAEALRQRPDLRAAERSVAAATARVGVAEAARYPNFRLSGSLGLEALTLGALDNGGAGASSLLGSISVPLFDAGRRRSQVEVQDALREQALVSYEKTLLAALQEVESALVALARNRERSAALTLATGAAQSAAELARQRYAAGLIDFQSVLDTERSVRALEDSLASTRTDGVLALIKLYKALGGGWSPQSAARPS